MFKKLYKKFEQKLDDIENRVVNFIKDYMSNNRDFEKELYDKVRWTSEHNRSKENYIQTLQSQQRTIEQLINALNNKYEKGLFIFSEDCKIPTVVRNGKILTNDLTSSFSIDWTTGEIPNIHIEQLAGTHRDEND